MRDTGGFILQPSSTTLATILQRQGWDTAAFVSSSRVSRSYLDLIRALPFTTIRCPNPATAATSWRMPSGAQAIQSIAPFGGWNAQSGKPYFLWVHLYDPHMPYQPPSPFQEKYKDRPYDGEIAYADRELGTLVRSHPQEIAGG